MPQYIPIASTDISSRWLDSAGSSFNRIFMLLLLLLLLLLLSLAFGTPHVGPRRPPLIRVGGTGRVNLFKQNN